MTSYLLPLQCGSSGPSGPWCPEITLNLNVCSPDCSFLRTLWIYSMTGLYAVISSAWSVVSSSTRSLMFSTCFPSWSSISSTLEIILAWCCSPFVEAEMLFQGDHPCRWCADGVPGNRITFPVLFIRLAFYKDSEIISWG